MKLIIDIDEDKFDLLQMAVMSGCGTWVDKMVANGIPLEEKENENESERMD